MKGLIPPGSGKYLSIGMETAVSFLTGLIAGYWIDRKTEMFPVWTALGTAGGAALGFYNLFIRLICYINSTYFFIFRSFIKPRITYVSIII